MALIVKARIARAAEILGLTLNLAACGGGGNSPPPPAHTIGGMMSGLAAGESVTLANNTSDSLAITGDGSFVFTKSVAQNSSYSVSLILR